jgi:hypothetical protein
MLYIYIRYVILYTYIAALLVLPVVFVEGGTHETLFGKKEASYGQVCYAISSGYVGGIRAFCLQW